MNSVCILDPEKPRIWHDYEIFVLIQNAEEPSFEVLRKTRITSSGAGGRLTETYALDKRNQTILLNGANYTNQTLINESGLYAAIFGSTLPEVTSPRRISFLLPIF